MGDIKQAEADSIEHESERLERRARTESDVPGMEHPLGKYEVRCGSGDCLGYVRSLGSP